MDRPIQEKNQASLLRRRISLFVIIGGILAAGIYIADRKMQPQLINGPMVQIAAANTIAVVWNAKSAYGHGTVTVTSPDGKTTDYAAKNVGHRYEALISDLQPGTQLQYNISNGGLLGRLVKLGEAYSTTTPKPRGTSFQFVAFGDSGNGSNSQAALAQLIAKQKPDVVIHVGDLIYPAGSMDDYDLNFFQPNAGFITFAPFMASLGNHDVATELGAPLLKVFTLPENGPAGIEAERNYYFDYGDARFVALDSNTKDGGGVITPEQMRDIVGPWVREVLTKTDSRWKFAFFHHPYYTASAHSPAGGKHMKVAFAQIFEECGVDIVFCGHNHLYERTSPMLKDQIVEDNKGIVYITTGAGGASRYPEDDDAPAYITKARDDVFSFTRVNLSANRLELTQIGENGETLDQWVKEKPIKSQG